MNSFPTFPLPIKACNTLEQIPKKIEKLSHNHPHSNPVKNLPCTLRLHSRSSNPRWFRVHRRNLHLLDWRAHRRHPRCHGAPACPSLPPHPIPSAALVSSHHSRNPSAHRHRHRSRLLARTRTFLLLAFFIFRFRSPPLPLLPVLQAHLAHRRPHGNRNPLRLCLHLRTILPTARSFRHVPTRNCHCRPGPRARNCTRRTAFPACRT